MNLLVALATAIQMGSLAEIDRSIVDGIGSGVYAGAVVVIGTSDTILYARGYGHLTWSSSSAVPDPDRTLYDLASLTKVVATTPAIMLLIHRGSVNLHGPVRDYLPGFVGEDKEVVTVRHLLSHQSGLRSFLPLDRLTETAAQAKELVLAEPLTRTPGARVVYSDLNPMLLGWVVESVTGLSLDQFVEAELFKPAEMTQTRFSLPNTVRARAAPVGLWRGNVVAGRVHDQNAAKLGGVSGHAGLYSTASDLARYAQLWFNDGRTRSGDALLSSDLVREFSAPAAGNRALGWAMIDTASFDNTGSRLSPRAFGHTGFTGTSIWIDPQLDLFVILLTNRVFAPRNRRSVSELKVIRGRVADASVELRIRSKGGP